MLSIGPMASGQESYYAALANEDYYERGGEPPGIWWGRGAAALELTGEVQHTQLRNVFRGFSPQGQKKLVRNAGASSRRAGFDLTFSAEKSVSAARAAASPEIKQVIDECHRLAVSKGLSYMEDVAGRYRKGTDGVDRERTGLVVAVFEHSTARAEPGEDPDPQIHSHCLVLNASPEGYAIDGRELFRHKMTAGALYRAELFAQLESRLGLTATKDGRFARLDIVPTALREEFSKRRGAVLHYMEELGVGDPKTAADAALRTRTSKTEVDRRALEGRWQDVCRSHGLDITNETVNELLGQRPPRRAGDFLRTAVPEALNTLTQGKSHFARRELVRAVAEGLEDQGVGMAAILAVVEDAIGRENDVVPVGELAGEVRYTTPEMLELEEDLLSAAKRLHSRAHGVSEEILSAVLEKRETMRDEQKRALEYLTKGRAIASLRGLAGTGKTYLLDAAREAWVASGYRVHGCALASIAARRLEEGAGISSGSIHMTLFELDSGQAHLDSKSVLVVDEAGMVGTRLMHRLVRHIEQAGAKLVLAGDERQLQAIEAGAPFARMAREFGSDSLTEITRQGEAWARDAVKQFARGEAASALRSFKDRSLFTVGTDRDDAMTQLVNDWRQVSRSALEGTLVLTGTRLEATILNRRIQASRFQDGELGEKGVSVGAYELRVGDRVLFRRNSKLVTNGDCGIVTKVDAEEGLLTAKLDRGERVTVDLKSYDSIQLGYAATTHVAQGATLKNCLVLCGGSMQDREATYVQASRARELTKLYTDEASAGEELQDLVRSMERSRAKDLAVDVAEQELELV